MTQLSSLLAALALAGCYSMSHAQVSTQGGVLVGPNGMTLYIFDKDMADSGKSACNGTCATNWPPLTGMAAPSGDGYSLIQRDDGTKQIAYKGKPLYYWIKDTKPGDKTGDGVNNVWHTATP
ncbi:hypothetical protein [Alicycliphilus denitrificans]|uniref:COG4315 family predicted lipoprotein n=1 Tax=Alicycliphilus denitrificans TaxID=179636 RepID=UPI00384C54DA